VVVVAVVVAAAMAAKEYVAAVEVLTVMADVVLPQGTVELMVERNDRGHAVEDQPRWVFIRTTTLQENVL
jgi:hypothetical protein